MVVARTSSETCPVAMLETYIQRGDIQMDSDQKLFFPVQDVRNYRKQVVSITVE